MFGSVYHDHEHQSATSYSPGTPAYSTTYYWYVIAKDTREGFISGPLWSFSTIGSIGVGQGAPNPQLFIDCYNRNGGATVFGSPINEVHRWGDGYIQDFRERDNELAIMQPDGVNEAYAIYGAIWQRYKSIGGAESPLGYPLMDEKEAGKSSSGLTGRWQSFGKGVIHRLREKNETWVLGLNQPDAQAISGKYGEYGGSGGQLGFPVSDDYLWQDGVRCDFEGGYIYRTSSSGALVNFPLTNNPPIQPNSPIPAEGATGVSINPTLSWSGGDPDSKDTVTYDIYFGTSSSPPLVKSKETTTSYNPGTLDYATKYYWQIVAADNNGASTSGPVWSFTTEEATNLISFPLPDLTADTVKISSILDHSGEWYKEDGIVRAWDGNTGKVDFGENCRPGPGYKNKERKAFNLERGFYVGAKCQGQSDDPRLYLNYDGHPGYDFPYDGKPILAAARGRLFKREGDDPVNCKTCGKDGNPTAWDKFHTFYIDHLNGYTTWYLHAKDLSQKVKDQIASKGYADVARREEIAYVGDFCSGCNVGPHLHFEVRRYPLQPWLNQGQLKQVIFLSPGILT